MEKTAGIVVIGDEILSGKFADENASFLIGALADLGVTLKRIAFIPDELDDIAETVRAFSGRFDLVVTSGGVGPTHDDLTMEGIARAFATQVVIHPDLESMLRDYWGREMPEANIRLAEVPDGAELIMTAESRWPTVYYRNVYILPGVPQLFRKKFRAISDRFRGTPTLVSRIFANADEGALAPHLDRAVAGFPRVKIGSYPRWDETEYQVIITLESKDRGELFRATSELENHLSRWLVKVERAE
ncbi:MAG: molybdopterin-binding protein [Proteobacteria bacterium]|nr:molybdopterin-binding protein [Pseudomonadota bacterium]